ncbi:MAG TPA: hypothetical protein VHX60_03875 [Acidobacteriaceae bacterium]|jgi:hypothetical protein|nr:hypothetical protein [Acidobacteriaceae bacterium]
MKTINHLTSACLLAGLSCVAWGSARPSAAAYPMTGYAVSPTTQQQDDTTPKQDAAKPQSDKDKDKDRVKDKDKANAPRPAHQPNARQQDDKNEPKDARAQADARGRSAGNHGRISDNDYQTHFGHEHRFSVRTVVTTTRIVPNQTRFAYGGYSFVFLEPWPAGWVQTDECYIDFINGEYVLVDVTHPGMQITLSIVG